MAGFTYATLTTAILNYTETDTNVLTSTITDQFIENSEMKILREIPLDAYKKQSTGNLVTGQNTINVPAKTLFVKGVQISGSNTTTYVSQYFGNGLLYACLVEAFSYLKGPIDMLTLYENKYKQEVQKFAGEQLGRRKRDDYTDGTVRIQVPSPSP